MKFPILSLEEVSASTDYKTTCSVTGLLWSKKISPDDYSLWLRVSALDTDAELRWDSNHGDEVVYVTGGALEVGGRRCEAGAALIVESGVAASARASEPTEIVHFGPTNPEPPEDGLYGPVEVSGHSVHVVGPQGRFAAPPGRPVFRFYADSTCPTCRATLLLVERDSTYVSAPHSHSQDELIYILKGTMLMGRGYEYGPGTCLPFQADQRYSFRAGSNGFTFLNYRRDVSLHNKIGAPGVRLESGLSQGGVEVVGEDQKVLV